MAAQQEERIDLTDRSEDRPDAGSATPSDLDRGPWKDAVKELGTRYQEHRVPLASGGLAYYWFLALFPALIALVGLVSLLGLGQQVTDTIVQGAQQALPQGASDVVSTAVQNAGQGGGGGLVAVIVGGAIALFGATKGMTALQQAMDIAHDVDADDQRGFFAKRGVAVVMLAATAVLGLSAAALVVFGQPLGQLVQNYVPVGDTVFSWAWTAVRWVAAILLISVLFSVLYYLAPSERSAGWRWVTPGGVVGAVIWAAASFGFSYYINNFGSYGETYGAIAGVVILVLWLFLTGLATLVGGELNAALDRRGGDARRPRW